LQDRRWYVLRISPAAKRGVCILYYLGLGIVCKIDGTENKLGCEAWSLKVIGISMNCYEKVIMPDSINKSEEQYASKNYHLSPTVCRIAKRKSTHSFSVLESFVNDCCTNYSDCCTTPTTDAFSFPEDDRQRNKNKPREDGVTTKRLLVLSMNTWRGALRSPITGQ
jgi:hypothetical protein